MPLDGSALKEETVSLNEDSSVEKEIPEVYEQWLAHYLDRGESLYFYRPQQVLVHTKAFIEEKNKRLLIIGPGRAESGLKYAELIQELSGMGFDIVVVDHRGQGFSGRILEDPFIGHVQNFSDYAHDLIHVCMDFQERKEYESTVFLGHGMGSIIGLQASLLRENLFDGAIISSPTFKMRQRRLLKPLQGVMLRTLDLLGYGRTRLLGPISDQIAEFSRNRMTSCERRFRGHQFFQEAYPQTKMLGPSIRWFLEAGRAGRDVWKKGKTLTYPILLMQAEGDRLACTHWQNKFAVQAKNCRIVKVKESRHEILHETDAIRNRALVQVRKFLAEVQNVDAQKPEMEIDPHLCLDQA